MMKDTITARLREILRVAEMCTEAELPVIERDILLSSLRELYRDIALGEAAACNVKGECESLSGEPEREAVCTMEQVCEIPVPEHMGEPDRGVQAPAQSYVKEEAPLPEPPAEDYRGEPAPASDFEFPRTEHKHRKAILSLYDDDADSRADENHPPVPAEAGLMAMLDEGQRAVVLDELFRGDRRECAETMEVLSRFDDLNDALVYIHENYKWDPDSLGSRVVADLLVERLS